jgi:Xaa-Pro dipeptidase
MKAMQQNASDALFAAHLATLAERFEAALRVAGAERAVVFAGPAQTIHRDDQSYPFRPEPYFLQWCPFAAMPEAVLEFIPGSRPRLLVPHVADYWHEPAALPDGPWREHFSVAVLDPGSIAHAVDEARTSAVAVGLSTTPLTRVAERDTVFLAYLDFFRAYKTPYEISRMREASARAVRGHAAVAAAFAGGVSEFELDRVYCGASEQRETELPYPNIIGINEHAAVLHYQHLRRTAPGQCRSLLIDAGASVHGYAADITRTYSRGDGRFAELISAMDSLQRGLCAEVTAGMEFVALNERAHAALAAVLEAHGLLKCSAETAFELGLTRSFLPHGLGHLLGLQVHDAGGRSIDTHGTERKPPSEHPFLRLTRRLEAGFVLTIEPGLYFIPQLLEALRRTHGGAIDWAAVEALLPYGGIRIEDNLLVESHGAENLTRSAFAALSSRNGPSP